MTLFTTKQLPPVTVLIPVYNLEDYVSDAITCAVCQDYSGELRIIVLDDGSTDQTLVQAKQAASRYSNILVYSQPNRGRAGTRNRLLEFSTTEIVSWLDGDDMAPPCWINEQVALLLSHPALVAVSGQGYAMNAKRLPIGPIPRPITHAEIEQLHLAGRSSAFFQSCATVRKSAVVAVGGYRLHCCASEDYDLWLRLSDIGKLQNHPNCHLYYRVHSTSANAILSKEQQQEGIVAANEARARRGLPELKPLYIPPEESPKKEDWKRQIYWINIAMKSGNARTAFSMAASALCQHSRSLLLWMMVLVSAFDSLLQLGNRTSRFQAGKSNIFRTLPYLSGYRLARFVVQMKRRLKGFRTR